MIETLRAAFFNLYKINNFIVFLILTFLLLPDTMSALIKSIWEYIPLDNDSLIIFLYCYIVIQAVFFIIELLNNFISISEDTKQVTTNLSQASQYIYIFLCLMTRKLILPPFENNLILFIYGISLVAMGNHLYHKLKVIFQNIRRYSKGEILFITIVLIWLYSTKVVDLPNLLNQLQLSNWIEQLNSLP